MENILIVSEKSWNKELVSYLQSTMPQYAFYLISQKEDFTVERIGSISPVKIFIPHWSYIIPSAIFERYECIVFHMTDLPYGRGGSPLQNLIVRGLTATKLSALRVEVGLDTGPVYLKMDLSLSGTAEEIFVRVNKLVGKMIVEIIQNNLQPVPQEGDPVVFKRRKPEQSDMSGLGKNWRRFSIIFVCWMLMAILMPILKKESSDMSLHVRPSKRMVVLWLT